MSRLRSDVRHIQQHLHRQLALDTGIEVVRGRDVAVLRDLRDLKWEQSSGCAAEVSQLAIVNLRELYIRRIRQEVRRIADDRGRDTFIKHPTTGSEYRLLIHRIG